VKSIDTNVLARFFIDDEDDEQAARQRPAAIAALSQRAMVTVTVLLEFEWLMRGFYGLSAREIGNVFRALAGIEHLSIEDRGAVITAFDAHEQGLDFADALHLARSARGAAFVTFDRRLAKRARSLGLTPEVELLG
jgi:predicted nucleic-acid-binding protein